MAMSEPSAGTDVLGMKTTASRGGDGSYTLNGAKMWITNGAVTDTELGDVFLVYARSGGKPGSKPGRKDYSLFLVEKGAPGFQLGQRIKDKCGMRASATAELVFDNVTVPAANLVGEDGDAVLHMMRNLEVERLTLAAMGLGIARRSIEVMNAYASDRQAFGSPLRDFGQIQRHIAESYAEYAAGKAYVYSVARELKLDVAGNRIDSDGVKLFCATMAKNVADRAVQALGGNGYVGEYRVEQLWRDAKLLEIGGGTAESHMRNMTKDFAKISTLP
jgi:isovaleryl-CoA dehydrogenase